MRSHRLRTPRPTAPSPMASESRGRLTTWCHERPRERAKCHPACATVVPGRVQSRQQQPRVGLEARLRKRRWRSTRSQPGDRPARWRMPRSQPYVQSRTDLFQPSSRPERRAQGSDAREDHKPVKRRRHPRHAPPATVPRAWGGEFIRALARSANSRRRPSASRLRSWLTTNVRLLGARASFKGCLLRSAASVFLDSGNRRGDPAAAAAPVPERFLDNRSLGHGPHGRIVAALCHPALRARSE